jgi:hypothetical protein
MDMNELLQNGIKSLAQRDLTTAREYFKMAIELDRHNESAWMWMSRAVETSTEKLFCLKQVLKINPNNQAARNDLQKLSSGEKAVSPPPATQKPVKPRSAESDPLPPPIIPAVPINNQSLSRSATPAQGALTPLPTLQIETSEPDLPRQNNCPVCGRDDTIRRVISIVEEGTERTTGTHSTTTETSISGRQHHYGENQYHFPTYKGSSKISGSATSVGTTQVDLTRQSDLASQLMPPKRPPEPAQRDMSCVDLLMIIAVPILAVALTVIIFFNSISGGGFGQRVINWGTLWWFPTLLVLGELMLYYFWRRPVSKEGKIKHKEEMILYEQNELAAWKKQMFVYEQLYYCFRDHVVFDPKKQLFCDPTQLQSFLGKLTTR